MPGSTPNTFYVVQPHAQSGLNILTRFQNDVNAAGDGGALGGLSGADLQGNRAKYRHTGTAFCIAGVTLAQANAIFAVAANDNSRQFIINDTGANGFAIWNTAQGKFGGEYHGLGTGSETVTVRLDGAAIDPTQTLSGNALTIERNGTIVFGNGDTVTYSFIEALGADGVLIKTLVSINIPFATTQGYLSMMCCNGNYVEGKHGDASGIYAAPTNQDIGFVYAPGTTITQLRDPTTGLIGRMVSNLPSKGNYKQAENRTQTQRNKMYQCLNGTPGTITNVVTVHSFATSAPGATSYPANRALNGGFDTDLTSWDAFSPVAGSAVQANGKMQMTRQAGTNNRRGQAQTLTVGGRYMLQVAADQTSATNARWGMGHAVSGSLNTPTPSALVAHETGPSGSGGSQAVSFNASQAQGYIDLTQDSGTAGQVINWDNVVLIELVKEAA